MGRTNFLREWINGKKFEDLSDEDDENKTDKITTLPIKKPEKVEPKVESPKLDQIRPSIAEKVKMGEGRRKLVSESEEKKKVEKVEIKSEFSESCSENKNLNVGVILGKQNKLLVVKSAKKVKRELSLPKTIQKT